MDKLSPDRPNNRPWVNLTTKQNPLYRSTFVMFTNTIAITSPSNYPDEDFETTINIINSVYYTLVKYMNTAPFMAICAKYMQK